MTLASAAGRATVSLGAASRAAAIEVRGKLLKVAGEMLQTPAEKLVLREGRVEIAGVRGSGATVAEVAQRAQALQGPPSAARARSQTRRRPRSPAARAVISSNGAQEIPIFAVHDCELAVGPETGCVEILSYTVVQDVGRALNPRAVVQPSAGRRRPGPRLRPA